MNFRSGEFSTGTTGNFQTELTPMPNEKIETTISRGTVA